VSTVQVKNNIFSAKNPKYKSKGGITITAFS
jgi:hypothetical protein